MLVKPNEILDIKKGAEIDVAEILMQEPEEDVSDFGGVEALLLKAAALENVQLARDDKDRWSHWYGPAYAMQYSRLAIVPT